MNQTRFVIDKEIYRDVLCDGIAGAKKFVWIATADIKDLYIKKGRRMVPFLEILSDLIENGIAVRLLHAKEPGPNFRTDFDRYPNLLEGLEQLLCPRVHFKSVVVDGTFAYSGSANLTGAGMGAKSDYRRNFESGIVTSSTEFVSAIMEQFDAVWMGAHCGGCGRKKFCSEYRDIDS